MLKTTSKKFPLFSIIVPMYNVENFIIDNLNSIRKQSYTNFEVIIVDDNSSDNSLKKVEKFLESNKAFSEKIKIVRFEANLGPSECRNVGLNMSLGEYIYFLDSDDLMHENLLKKAVTIFNDYDDIDLFTFGANFFNEIDSQILQTGFLLPKYEKTYTRDEFLEHTFKQRNTAVWMNVYKKAFLVDKKLKFYEGIFYEDALFTEQVIYNMSKIYCCEEILVEHRVNTSSITQYIKDEAFRIDSYKTVLKQTNEITVEEKDKVIKKYLNYQQAITLIEIFKFSSISISNLFSIKKIYSIKGGYKFYLRVFKILCLKFIKNK